VYPYQRLVIQGTLEAGGYYGAETSEEINPRRIVVLPTGAGKSLCFILPALLLDGVTLVIFPLLGLMNDQERRLSELGIPHGTVRGGQEREERRRILSSAADGSLKILVSNPEALLSPAILPRLRDLHIAHVVIDETHTVSEWGDTFRPAYLRIADIVDSARPKIVTAFTATASAHILRRVEEVVFGVRSGGTASDPPQRILANPDRPNISYAVIPALSKTRALVRLLAGHAAPGHGSEDAVSPERHIPGPSVIAAGLPAIVFCGSRDSARLTASMLRRRLRKEDVFFYHAGLLPEEKRSVERWFFSSRTGVLCSTCAYGMGVDKSDVRTVIHRDLPPSVEAYLQESGRGGRDKRPASAFLIASPEDAARLRDMAEPAASERYRQMLDYAFSVSGCRREMLLGFLGAEPEFCETCDLCAGTAVIRPPELAELCEFFRKNRRITGRGRAARILGGVLSYRGRQEEIWRYRDWGILSDWEEAEIKEAVQALVCSGILSTKGGKRESRLRYHGGSSSLSGGLGFFYGNAMRAREGSARASGKGVTP
jgi:ATP-dependent DNA helicase RecQ